MDDLSQEIKNRSELKKILLPIIYSYKEKRDIIFESTDREELRDKMRKLKENSLDNMTSLKEQAIAKLRSNGIKVFEVADQKEAKRLLNEIIGAERCVVKSKSNLANEINLKEILASKEITETDIGDFLVDICDEKEAHPVLPALLLTPEKISSIIKRKLGQTVEPSPEAIVEFVKNKIREKILHSKVGITGANAITADGSIMILENEGNISLVTRIPEKHIILASFDKIVSTREDALLIVKCAAIYGTGQDYPSYVSLISGPSKTADIQNETVTGAQGAKEVYLLLVDNGRSEILKSEFRDLLYCINCGACLNFCPIYHQITTKYGSIFPGPKGVLSSLFLEGLRKSFDNGAFYCTGCLNCKENCPSNIDLPGLIKKLRARLVESGIQPKAVEEMIRNVQKFGNPFGEVPEGKTPDKLFCC